MALDRDELAARFFAVILTPLVGDDPADEWDMGTMAGAAVEAADALIARLRPATVAPVADAAPRPEWVRLMSDYNEPHVRKVVRWSEDGHPVVMHSDGLGELRPLNAVEWEPCAAPSPPAAYVPKRGDRVMHFGPDDGRRFVVTRASPLEVIRVDSRRSAFCVSGPWIDNSAPVYLGPATDAERVAAGLDAPAKPAVDREGLAGVMRAAWYDEEAPWDEARPRVKADWLRAADAAIAFLKANGGVA